MRGVQITSSGRSNTCGAPAMDISFVFLVIEPEKFLARYIWEEFAWGAVTGFVIVIAVVMSVMFAHTVIRDERMWSLDVEEYRADMLCGYYREEDYFDDLRGDDEKDPGKKD